MVTIDVQIKRLLLKLCSGFPLGLALLLSVFCFAGGWEPVFADKNYDHFFLPGFDHAFPAFVCFIVLLSTAVFITSIVSMFLRKIKTTITRFLIVVSVVFVVTLLLRLIWIVPFREDWKPFSDFYRIWELAHGHLDGNIEYYSLFPTYLNYAVFLSKCIELLGDNYVNILVLNCVFSAVTAAALAGIVWEVFNKEGFALEAGLLYGFMPANILYCSVSTPEFITVCFNTVGVLFLILWMNSRDSRKWFRLVFAGFFLGLGASYKSFSIVIIIAYAIIELIKVKRTPKPRFKKLLIILLWVLVLSVSYKCAKTVVVKYTEKHFSVSLDESTALPNYLLIGLNTEGEGQIHLGTLSRVYVNEYLKNGFNAEDAKESAWQMLKTDWEKNYERIPGMLWWKTVWAWQSDLIGYTYLESEGLQIDSESESGLFRIVTDLMPVVLQLYYLCILLLGIIGIRKIYTLKDPCSEAVFLALIILGFAHLMLLTESQSRYKCLVLPYICAFSALGIQTIISSLKTKLTKC